MKDQAPSIDRGLFERLFFENYALKLLSLAFAVALFSVVHTGHDAQRSLFIDVVALLPPANADTILVSTLPARVKVTLRGSRARVAGLGPDDFAPVQMDLREPGRQFYYFDTSAISVSGPLRVVSIEPPSVQLTWRQRAERTVQVRVKLSGNPEPGYAVRRPIVVTPPAVTIAGPKEELDVLSLTATEEINVDGLGPGVHERQARLEPLPGHIGYQAQNAVSVRVEIEAETREQAYAGLDVAALGPGHVTLRPPRVEVTVRGPSPQLAKLGADQLVPFVEPAGGLAVGSVESLAVSVRGLPDSCSVVRIVPNSVLVRHEKP